MKKSMIYKLAQMAVLNYERIGDTDKLQVLRELIAAEDLALFCESQEEKETAL